MDRIPRNYFMLVIIAGWAVQFVAVIANLFVFNQTHLITTVNVMLILGISLGMAILSSLLAFGAMFGRLSKRNHETDGEVT
jgi:hypothetical protein